MHDPMWAGWPCNPAGQQRGKYFHRSSSAKTAHKLLGRDSMYYDLAQGKLSSSGQGSPSPKALHLSGFFYIHM